MQEFVQEDDHLVFGLETPSGPHGFSHLRSVETVIRKHIVNSFQSVEALHAHIDSIDLLDPRHLRPVWDDYFMVLYYKIGMKEGLTGIQQTLAELASQRSNCMKRRVGAILVRECRIVSTGSVDSNI